MVPTQDRYLHKLASVLRAAIAGDDFSDHEVTDSSLKCIRPTEKQESEHEKTLPRLLKRLFGG